MPDDETLERTWDMVERLSETAPVTIEETSRGVEFKNYKGDVVGIIYIAGTES